MGADGDILDCRQGLVRYCPICDGYESRDQKIAVIAYGSHGVGEAVFIARTYSDDVTLLTLGQPLELDPEQRAKLDQHRIKVVENPVGSLDIEDNRIAAIHFGGREHRFDVLYSALGQHMSAQLSP
jgi:thioredoxin reductase (NADPH)